MIPDPTDRSVYPLWARDTARYGDTDLNGHLNNAAFSTFRNSQAPHREQERRSWRYGGASVIRIKRG